MSKTPNRRLSNRGPVLLIAATLAISMGLPSVAQARILPNVSEPKETFYTNTALELNPQRLMYDDVLDTYCYFYCWSDSSHNKSLMYPTYTRLSYRSGYSRLYPDEILEDNDQYPCPYNKSHFGLLKRFKCHYSTW